MDNQKLTLAIFGNQHSNSGFQPLYWINNPVQQLENLVPPGMEENKYFFVVETTPTCTQFTLIQNHVSSYMSVRPGVLKMAITLPPGYQLASGVSPFDVLMRVRQTFIEQCLTQKSALSETYNFNNKLAPIDVFADIVNSYALVPAISRHRPMCGSDDALLLVDSEERISQLFLDVQYPEFEPYRRIVVATHGNTTAYAHVLSQLDIPHRPNLQLIVNGRPMAWTVADYYNEATTIDLRLNQRCWESTPVSFTVSQLMAGRITDTQHGIDIYIDSQREQVVCNVQPVPKRTIVKVQLEGCPDPAAVLPSLTVLVGPKKRHQPLSVDGCFQLSGDDIMYLYTGELTAHCANTAFDVKDATVTDDNSLHITLGPAAAPVQQPLPTQAGEPISVPPLQQSANKPLIPQKYMPWLIGALCAVVVGLLLALLLRSCQEEPIRDNDSHSNVIENGSDINGADEMDEEDIYENIYEDIIEEENYYYDDENEGHYSENLYNYFANQLASPDLAFETIDQMARWVAHPDVARGCNETDGKFVNKVNAYKQIVDLLRQGSLDEALRADRNLGKPLDIVHRWQLNAADKGWATPDGRMQMYDAESRQKASKVFADNYKDYQSFSDIDNIHNTPGLRIDHTPTSQTDKPIEGWPTTSANGTGHNTDRSVNVDDHGNIIGNNGAVYYEGNNNIVGNARNIVRQNR